MNTAASSRYASHRADVLALMAHIAGCLDCHPDSPIDGSEVTWDHVAGISLVRARLIDAAACYATETTDADARTRIEAALRSDPDDVLEALIETASRGA